MASRRDGKRTISLEPLEPRVVLTGVHAAVVESPVDALARGLVLKALDSQAQIHQAVTFAATDSNPITGRPIRTGKIQFLIDSPSPVVLGTAKLNRAGRASFTTHALDKVGTYWIEARYVSPNGTVDPSETAGPTPVVVTPLSVTSFRVVPAGVHYGRIGEPMSFTVTALNAAKQPVTDYTGTVQISSPTDSSTTFSKQFYISYHLPPPIPWTLGLPSYATQIYQFQPSDHGTHTFRGGITFGKGGAEAVKVAQANDPRIHGQTVFAIS